MKSVTDNAETSISNVANNITGIIDEVRRDIVRIISTTSDKVIAYKDKNERKG